MKITAFLVTPRRLATALALLLLLASAPRALAQGSLTPPPGAPAPTMKTLAQLEPRIPLQAGASGVTAGANGGFTITAPGSYYLTRNLTVASGHAIAIDASGVTLDLSGFEIRSNAPAATTIGDGISVLVGRSRITIRHGSISGQGTVDITTSPYTYTARGFDSAIYAPSSADLVTIEDVQTEACRSGIYLDDGSTLVRDCAATRHGFSGIFAGVITSSTATAIGGTALQGLVVSFCRGSSQTGYGIYSSEALNCIGSSFTSYGIFASDTATNCGGSSVSGTGLFTTVASNCHGVSTSGLAGLNASNATNCRGSNVSGTVGLTALGTAAFCRGARPSGTAIYAPITIGCTASSGTITATNRYLMP